jgi:D-alanine transaminase
MTTCYINGKYKPLSQSTVSVTDRGYQFSDGVYEAIAVFKNEFVDFKLHLNRLFVSLKKMDMKINLNKNQIESITKKIKKINQLEMGIVYIQITRGDQNPREHKYSSNLKPNIVIYSIIKNFEYLNKLAKKGVKTSLYPDVRWQRSDIKSISLLGNVLAANHAKKNKSHEAVLFDNRNMITEGNSSSIWIIKKNKCITHPLNFRILKGCTRHKLISILKKNKFKFEEKKFSITSLLSTDEAFMTSATNFIMPIIKVDKYTISNGKPGLNTLKFRNLFIDAI